MKLFSTVQLNAKWHAQRKRKYGEILTPSLLLMELYGGNEASLPNHHSRQSGWTMVRSTTGAASLSKHLVVGVRNDRGTNMTALA